MSELLNVKRLDFKAGGAPGTSPLTIHPSNITILVGPNNSGKSLALREIESWCMGENNDRLLLANIEVEFPTDPVVAQKLLDPFKVDSHGVNPENIHLSQHRFNQTSPSVNTQVNSANFDLGISNGNENILRSYLTAFYTIRLDGRSRFALTDPQPFGDLQEPPSNHLASLFRDDDARDQVRQLGEHAFNLHFVIDPTGIPHIRIRLSDRKPEDTLEEQALDSRAR